MSEASLNNPNFLDTRAFARQALGKIGVENVGQLTPRDMARIALALHLQQADGDEANVSALELEPDKAEAVLELIIVRGVQMRTLLETLTGFGGRYDDLKAGELFM